jgi:hypothetical protein
MASAVCALDIVISAVVGALAVFASIRGGWHPSSSAILTVIPPAIAANLSLRFHRQGAQRGDSLVVGLVRFWHDWIDAHVAEAVELWARRLHEADLMTNAAKPDVVGQSARSSLKVRREWRAAQVKDLQSTSQLERTEAQVALQNAVVASITLDQRSRPK